MVALYINTRQRDASANTPPQGSRGLAVVLACLEEVVILGVRDVLVARVSCQIGVATSAHGNRIYLSASCRQQVVPNML
jgi:hypothetical protein